MSHYAMVEVQYTNKDALVLALMAAGFKRSQIEAHDNPRVLYDYTGQVSKSNESDPRFAEGDRAHVIIRRKFVGACCNDFGIYLDAEKGSREFACADAKVNARNCVLNPEVRALGGFGPWAQRLKREYAVAVAEQDFHDQGLVTERVDAPDGNIYVYASC